MLRTFTVTKPACTRPSLPGHSGSKAQQSLGFLLASCREILYQQKQNPVSRQNGLILDSGRSDFKYRYPELALDVGLF